jgi:hypothetical protein
MKVRIIQSKTPNLWYVDKIGEIHNVNPDMIIPEDEPPYYEAGNDKVIKVGDCIEVYEEPKANLHTLFQGILNDYKEVNIINQQMLDRLESTIKSMEGK